MAKDVFINDWFISSISIISTCKRVYKPLQYSPGDVIL